MPKQKIYVKGKTMKVHITSNIISNNFSNAIFYISKNKSLYSLYAGKCSFMIETYKKSKIINIFINSYTFRFKKRKKNES